MLLALLTLSSCEKYLDKDPVDRLTPEQAFGTENSLRLYTNSFYVQLMPDGPAIYQGDVMADITVPNKVPDFLGGSLNSNNASGWSWGPLRNINYFLENYNNPEIPVAVRNNYAGIARFFRAWFYFNKVKQFGDVPWYGHTLSVDDPDLYKGRDSRQLVMDSVLADINFACENISAVKDNSASTITRSVALAMKSRICLFEGTFRKYHTGAGPTGSAEQWLSEAVNAADLLIKSKQYSLLNTGAPEKDYRSLFISENPVSNEVLLAAVYNNSLKRWHNAAWWYNSATYGARLGLSKSFVNTYLNTDGTPFTQRQGYDTIQFQNEVKNRDARLQQTIRTGSYRRSDGTVSLPDFNVTYSAYQIIKFSLDDKYFDTRAESFNSIPIVRYAEVLLNYAEARAELGDLTADDWNLTVGATRKRAGILNTTMPGVVDPYMKSKFFGDVNDPALMEIRRERGIELAAEGNRFDDLKRWRAGKLLERPYDGLYVPAKGQLLDLNEDRKPDVAFVDKMPDNRVSGVVYYLLDNSSSKLSNGSSGNLLWLSNTTKVFEDKKYFYPIPANEIVLNPNLTQNTGW